MTKEKEAIPTTPFDPKKHVIECRDREDGTHAWVTLESIAAAERTVETSPPASAVPPHANVAPSPARPPAVEQEDLAAIERRILAAIPPPQFPADLMAELTEATKAAITLKQQNEALTARVAALETIMSRLGEAVHKEQAV